MTRSLVIAPQWIGDAVMSEPLLARLAAHGEQLAVAALPWVAPVYRAMPQVGEVIELPFAHGRLDWSERKRIAAGLRGRFDTAYVLPNSLKSALIPWLAHIPRRIGYQGEGRVILLNKRLPNPAGRPPMVAFYSALAGPNSSGGERPLMKFSASALEAAEQAAGVHGGAYWVFAPGAEYGPAKCWPADRYAELARGLFAAHGQPVLLLGSGKEAALCEAIAAAAPGACRVLAGKTTLLDAMALIAASRGVVSNDSGLMHVAAAFGVPQAAVFGSTSPEHTPPLNERARVVWMKDELQLDCAPCFDRVCRFGHTRCLTEVSAARVDAALTSALQSTSLPT
jgi:heptosyltransferase-2